MTFWNSYWWPAVTALIGFAYVGLRIAPPAPTHAG